MACADKNLQKVWLKAKTVAAHSCNTSVHIMMDKNIQVIVFHAEEMVKLA